MTAANGEGEQAKETAVYCRDDFGATKNNNRLNFLQHVEPLLKIYGRATIIVPYNVLFEGGAGVTVRQKLLLEDEEHAHLRLASSVFYTQGVNANVLFFERKSACDTPSTRTL
jgi:type I restriction enzyme M protein